MPRDRAAIEKALSKKGFEKDGSHPHHRYFHFRDGETYTGIHTHISRGSGYKIYSDSLLSKMYKQLKLNNRNQLLELIDCSMDEKKYREILTEKGLI